MFERLFNRPITLAQQWAGPLLEDRLRYLSHLAEQGVGLGEGRIFRNGLLDQSAALMKAFKPRAHVIFVQIKARLEIEVVRFG